MCPNIVGYGWTWLPSCNAFEGPGAERTAVEGGREVKLLPSWLERMKEWVSPVMAQKCVYAAAVLVLILISSFLFHLRYRRSTQASESPSQTQPTAVQRIAKADADIAKADKDLAPGSPGKEAHVTIGVDEQTIDVGLQPLTGTVKLSFLPQEAQPAFAWRVEGEQTIHPFSGSSVALPEGTYTILGYDHDHGDAQETLKVVAGEVAVVVLIFKKPLP